MTLWTKLPDELWAMIGDFMFCDLRPHKDSIVVILRPANFYRITFEEGVAFVEPECILS